MTHFSLKTVLITSAAVFASLFVSYKIHSATAFAAPLLETAVSVEIPQEGIYDLMLSSTAGPLTYYNQGDARWKDSLYGKRDPFFQYGCGPTVMAMVVTTLSGELVTPPQMGEWSAENNCWCPGQGSYHNLIPDSAKAYGLDVQSLGNCSVAQMKEALAAGKLLVILVRPGDFTDRGHFLIVTEETENGMFRIADSGTYENTKVDWEPELVRSNLNRNAGYGGPVWAIGPAPLTSQTP